MSTAAWDAANMRPCGNACATQSTCATCAPLSTPPHAGRTTRLTADELDAIDERARKATRGPWVWTDALVNAYIRAVRGKRSRAQYVYLLQGDKGSTVQDHIDAQVLHLRWSDVRGTHFTGGPGRADMAFIAHARTDIPALVAEVRRLRALLADDRS